MVCPTTAFAAWDSMNLCVVLSFIKGFFERKKGRRKKGGGGGGGTRNCCGSVVYSFLWYNDDTEPNHLLHFIANKWEVV